MKLRQKKKFIKASAALAVATSAIVVPMQTEASNFSDLAPSQYFYEDVLNLQERGIINGFSDGTFKPNASLTRGQAAKMIAGVLKLDTTNVVNPDFTDIDPAHQYYGVIAALKQAGIIDGYTDGTFKPGETVQRNHVAKILANALQLKAKNVDALPFTDINASYKEVIAALYENNVTTGKTETTFDGKAFVTRGQMAAFIARAEKAVAPTETQSEAISGVITNVTATEITIDQQTYTIPATLKAIFNKENAQALAQAPIKATVKGTELTALNSLTIVAVGTKEAPVVLQGVMQPVASTTPVNAAIDFAGILQIQAPYVQVKNFNIAQLHVAPQVVQLTVDAKVKALTVLENAAPTILGNAAIETLTIASEKAVALETTGEITTLVIQPTTAAVTVGKAAAIGNIETKAANVQSVISNYEAIAQNITNVNGQNVVPVVPTPSISTGTTPSPSKPAPQTKEVSGIVDASSNAKLTIDGKNYTFDAKFASLFASSALAGATMSVSVKDGKIVAITALTVNTPNTVLEADATINGNVVIDADNVSLKGFTITGDVQLTEKVKEAVNFDETDIKGKLLTVEEQQPVAKAQAKSRMLVASAGAVAAETKTRLKITFANSSVAYIEIKTEDTDLSMFGQTTITVISVESNNSSIFADPEVVLPTVQISRGATKIELNASIASVEITSTSSVEVTGKGNFDKVKVDVPEDKAVSLKTEGTIKEIATNTNGGIELSETVKVGKTTDLQGVEKPAEEVVKNYEDVKDNINVDIKDEELEQYIVAKVMPVEDRFGYATLHVQNAENYTVKYRLTDRHEELVVVGEPAPADAMTYNKGDEFIAWRIQEVEVYKVDKDGLVADAFRADNWVYYGAEQTLQVQDGKLTVKTNFAPLERISLPVANFVNNGQFFYMDASTKAQWSVDADGIPTYTVELPEDFKYDATQEARLQYTIEADKGNRSTTTWESINSYDETRMVDVVGLNGLANLSDVTKGESKFFIEQLLRNNAYEEVKVVDKDTGYEYTTHETLYSNYLKPKYTEALQKTPLTSHEQIKELVVNVNKENAPYLAAIKEAEKVVVALFKENRYDYEYYEQLADDVTAQKIEDAQKLVTALNDTENELEVSWALNQAQEIYKQIKKIFTLQTAVQQLELQDRDTAAYWNARNEIQSTLSNFAYEVPSNGYHVSFANPALFDQYAKQLAQQPIKNIAELKQLVNKVNEANAEFLKNYASAKKKVEALLVKDYYNVKSQNRLAAGVTAEKIEQAQQAVDALSHKEKNTELDSLMSMVQEVYETKQTLANVQEIAKAYLKAVENQADTNDLRNKLNPLFNYLNEVHWVLFDEYVKQIVKDNVTTREQIETLVANLNGQYEQEIVRYEAMVTELQALYGKNKYGQYTSEKLSETLTPQQFAKAKEQLAQFNKETTLTVNLDHYIYDVEYLFNVESPRPAQLIETRDMLSNENESSFVLTFSEAVQGDNIALDFSGVEATKAEVQLNGNQLIVTTVLENKTLPTVTITGVQDMNGNAIELATIPLMYWKKK